MSTKVKMLARWSELTLRNSQTNREEAELKRIISGEEGPEGAMMMADVVHQYGPVVFNLKDVKRYNKSKERGHTTVHFKNGDSLILKVSFLDFMELDLEHVGEQILDFTPLDYQDEDFEEDDIPDDEEDLEL